MPRYQSSQHHFVEAVRWRPEQDAERVNDHILLSRGTTSSYLVITDAGDVVINTGFAYQGDRHRERFEKLLGRELKVRKILLTQCHPDLVGGWAAFADEGSETIVQRNFAANRGDRVMLFKFFEPRRKAILHGIMPDPDHAKVMRFPKDLEAQTVFNDFHAFELGGRRFEIYSVPAGETTCSVIVWMPDDGALFTGNMMGALYGALPHLYTLRGDRGRSTPQFIRDVERIISLKPRLLLTGHDDPVVGEDRILADMTKLRDAVRHIFDETINGMNAGVDLFTLMREIRLPPHLEMAPGRGPVSWYVRAVWEEHTGWFRHERTTELYPTPAADIWPRLAEMAGGPEALAAEARRHLTDREPVKALHFIEIALAAAPQHRGAREAELDALEQLIDLTEGKTYDELGWLETKVREAKEVLGRGVS